ncbi:MAG: TetR/AcrR family transcriptional regulator [Gammaproteobacteria bacterium]|nr:TetR/AcrR family transcriptional regulator [Gammaproteobacteria bacterium]
MARKPAKEQGDTLRIIIDSAFALFGKFGYDGVSVDQIAKKSDLSKGAMYWHFKNKDDLYVACLKEVHDIFNRYVFSAIAGEANVSEALASLTDGVDTMLHDRLVMRGIAGYWLEPSGRADKRRIDATNKAFQDNAMTVLGSMFERGRSTGQLAFDENPEDIARALMALIENSVLTLRRGGAEESRHTSQILMKAFFRAYGKGLAPANTEEFGSQQDSGRIAV